jgi:hypothetical protein
MFFKKMLKFFPILEVEVYPLGTFYDMRLFDTVYRNWFRSLE